MRQILSEALIPRHSKLKDKSLNDTEEDLVGVGSRVEELMSILAIGSNDVGIIGISLMGRSGKTTLVRAVYNKIFNHFETCSFVKNVGEESKAHGLKTLQERLLCDIGKGGLRVKDVHKGIKEEKILILDDENQLGGNWDWFGQGNRIIITTKGKHWCKYIVVKF